MWHGELCSKLTLHCHTWLSTLLINSTPAAGSPSNTSIPDLPVYDNEVNAPAMMSTGKSSSRYEPAMSGGSGWP